MFGIIDIRYNNDNTVGILRGKSKTIKNAIKKSRIIYKHLTKYEDNIDPLDLCIQKLIGTIKLGDTVEHSQVTVFPI